MKYPALRTAVNLCIANGLKIDPDLLLMLESVGINVKALQDYDNQLNRIVSIYLNDLRTHPGLAGGSFGTDFADAISAGLNEAWRAGMRQNDVTDMLPEWQDTVDGIIADERSHIPDFAGWLTEVANNADTMGQAITQAQVRLSLWIGRYQDVFNQAVLASADEKTKLKWVMGATEKHCTTCQGLDGIIAYQREWEAAGVRPQSPPNGQLECGGWNCLCSLQPTDERKSPNAYDKIIAVVLGGPGGP